MGMTPEQQAEWLRKQYGLPKPSKAKLKRLAAERQAAQQLVEDRRALLVRQEAQKVRNEAAEREAHAARVEATRLEIEKKFAHLRENRR